jgi:hypothetical protein
LGVKDGGRRQRSGASDGDEKEGAWAYEELDITVNDEYISQFDSIFPHI